MNFCSSSRSTPFKGFLLLLLLSVLPLLPARRADAAAKPASITSCELVSASKVKVTAKLADPKKVSGDRCYLFALGLSNAKISADAKPLKSKKKAKTMTFTFSLNKAKASSVLNAHFVLAEQHEDGSYVIISNTKYLSNPSRSAKYTYTFPTASSKKGLQVSASMLEDAVELNVQHSVLNIVFTEMIAAKTECDDSSSYSYRYHGRTYWYRRSVIDGYDRQLTALKETDAVVSAVLLLGWRSDLTDLIYPSGREYGHSFYAWNTRTAAAREQLQAALSFLANRYASSDAGHGRIANWIVGNEVNNYKVYNYAGQKSLKEYAKIYAAAFRMTYNTVSSVYANARVYISLDHLWNTNTVSGTFAARRMLDSFASALKSQGNIPWNLAYHPYSSPLTEPRFWANTRKQLTQALSTPVINMGNIGILSSYIREKYGSSTRIILSEQGYTSVQSGKNVEKEQSAAIVYSYYLTESDDMIDSFIMNRQVDHDVEVKQGLNLGLWTTDGGSNPEWADEKKDSWTVFKYMDTNKSRSVADASLSVIGVSDWSEVIPGYSSALYNKVNRSSASMKLKTVYPKKAGLSSKWKKYGAAISLLKTDTGRRVTHDPERNRNSLWGFSQTFPKKTSFAKATRFCATLRAGGSTDEKVTVKIIFYSGKNFLESTKVLSAGRTVPVSVSLAKWKYRKSVTKIQILLAPCKGDWEDGSFLEISNVWKAL